MKLLHLPLEPNPISSQLHTWVAIGWISLMSEGMLIFFRKGCFFRVILWFFEFFVYFVGLFMFCHACKKHIIINFLFLLDNQIHDVYILEHQLDKPGITFLYPIVAYAWIFYHTCICFSFLSLWFSLIFIYLSNDSMGIPLCRTLLNLFTNTLFTYAMDHLF